jgi:hypothetical protein
MGVALEREEPGGSHRDVAIDAAKGELGADEFWKEPADKLLVRLATTPAGLATRLTAVGRKKCYAVMYNVTASYRVKTVLPCVLPSHIARKASFARSMGRTFPISGAMPALAMKAIMSFMS